MPIYSGESGKTIEQLAEEDARSLKEMKDQGKMITAGGIEIKIKSNKKDFAKKAIDFNKEESEKKEQNRQRILELYAKIDGLEADILKKGKQKKKYVDKNLFEKAETIEGNLKSLAAQLEEGKAELKKLENENLNIKPEKVEQAQEKVKIPEDKKEVFDIGVKKLEEIEKMSVGEFLEERMKVLMGIEKIRKAADDENLDSKKIKELNQAYRALIDYQRALEGHFENIAKDVTDKGKIDDIVNISSKDLKVNEPFIEPFVQNALKFKEIEKTEEEKWQELEKDIDIYYAGHDFLKVTDIANLEMNIKRCDMLKAISTDKLVFVPVFKDSLSDKLEKHGLDHKKRKNVVRILDLERPRLGGLAAKLREKLSEEKQKEAEKNNLWKDFKKKQKLGSEEWIKQATVEEVSEKISDLNKRKDEVKKLIADFQSAGNAESARPYLSEITDIDTEIIMLENGKKEKLAQSIDPKAEIIKKVQEIIVNLENAKEPYENRIDELFDEFDEEKENDPDNVAVRAQIAMEIQENRNKIHEIDDKIKKQKLIINNASGHAGAQAEKNMANQNPDINRGQGEAFEAKEGLYEEFHYDEDPIGREMTLDNKDSLSRIEKKNKTNFDLDQKTVIDPINDIIKDQIDEKVEKMAIEFLKDKGEDWTKELTGSEAIRQAEAIRLDDKDSEFSSKKAGDSELRNFYKLKIALNSEGKRLLKPEARILVLDILNKKAKGLDKPEDKAEYDRIFALREKMTQTIAGKDYAKNMIESRGLNSVDDDGKNIFVENTKNIVLSKVEDAYKNCFELDDATGKRKVQEEALPFDNNNNACKSFIERHINNADLEKFGLDDPYVLACLQKAGYSIKATKGLIPWHKETTPVKGPLGVDIMTTDKDGNEVPATKTKRVLGQEKIFTISNGQESFNLKSKDAQDKLADIVIEAREKWKDEFEPHAQGALQQEIQSVRSEKMKAMANPDSLDKYYGHLEDDILVEDFYSKLSKKEKTREQLKAITERFGGDEQNVKDSIFDLEEDRKELAEKISKNKDMFKNGQISEDDAEFINSAFDILGFDRQEPDKFNDFISKQPIDVRKSVVSGMSGFLRMLFEFNAGPRKQAAKKQRRGRGR